MNSKQDDPYVSRRTFLKGAAVTAVAATATGAGAGVWRNQIQPAASVPAATVITTTAPPAAVATLPDNSPELLARLAAAQAENARLQAELEASQRQLELFQQMNADNSAASEMFHAELATANQRVNVLTGLLALYQQLDEVKVGTVLENGLAAVSGVVADLLRHAPTLEEGVAAGRQALDQFEAQIPLVQNGRSWLSNQITRLQTYFNAIERILEKTVDRVGPFLEMLQEWFAGVQKWLPFGVGQRAVEIMESITALLVETPHTIQGLRTNVAEPLDVWLAGQADDTPLKRNLLKPLREEVLSPAGETTAKARDVEAVYQTQLAEPVQTAVDRQRAIRNLIAQYREQHQINL